MALSTPQKVLALAVLLPSACSSSPTPSTAKGNAQDDGLGSVGMAFTLPSGQVLNTLAYQITNGTNTYQGTVNVAGSSSLTFVVGGVASGAGYTLTLSGTTTDGLTSCAGTSAPFSVSNRHSTAVSVQLSCTTASDAGSTIVNPVTNDCPIWNTIVANPAGLSIQPGQNVALITGSATGPNNAQLIYTWSVTTGTGTLSNQSAQGGTTSTIQFTCPQSAEDDIIQLVVSDQAGAMCPTSDTTGTVTVVCTSPSPCFEVGSGIVAVPDTATGTCPAGLFNNMRSPSGDFCCSSTPTVNYAVVRQGVVGAAQLADGTATPVFIEYHTLNPATLADTLVSTMAMPTAASGAQQPFAYQGIASVSGINDGALSLSLDGHFLTLVGYGATPGTASIVTTMSVPRVVARVSPTGTIDTSTFFTVGGAFVNAFIRSSATLDGSAFWVGGTDNTTGGLWYIPFGTHGGGTQLNSQVTRVVNLFGGQLYADSDPVGTMPELFTAGTGLPTAPPATDVVVPGFPQAATPTATVSPWAFAFVGASTLYVASDQAIASGNPPNGIQKWTLSGGTWTLQTTFNLAPGQAVATPVGFRALAVAATGNGSTTFIGTTVEPGTTSAPANHLAVFVDNGVTGNGSGMTEVGQVFLQAPSNTLYRGLALMPH
jgi:hypothetical protein